MLKEIIMNKKAYMQPAMQVNKIQPSNIICGSGPGSGDQHNPGGPSRQLSDFWDDDEDVEDDR